MKRQKTTPSKKLPLLAYLILVCYICIFFTSVWFASYQNKLALQMREDFKQQKNQLLDEIHKLELQEAELTSMKRIHKIARELQMVQPSEPVQILRDNEGRGEIGR